MSDDNTQKKQCALCDEPARVGVVCDACHDSMGTKAAVMPAAPSDAGWQPLATAPAGERVLLGPRHAPVVGIVRQMPEWADEQDPVAAVIHYNDTTLVAGYHCSEWHPLPAVNATQAEPAAGEQAGAVAYQVHEEDSLRIHATLYAPVLKEFCLEATRDDDGRNWYIEVTDEGGYHTYDGYWRDSHGKSRAEVLAEAVSGSMLDEISAPPQDAIPFAAPGAAIAARKQCVTCGASEPFTGSCGTSDSDTGALCKRASPKEAPATPQAGEVELRTSGDNPDLEYIDDIIFKLECFIDHATGGKLSKSSWALETLKAAHDEYVKAREDEAVAEVLEATQPTTVQQAELTDEQIQAAWDEACKDSPQKPGWCRHIRFARAVLALKGMQPGERKEGAK